MKEKDPSIQILSDITVFTKYARFRKDLKRRETWEEIVTRNKNMHKKKYPQLAEEIDAAYQYVYDKKVLPSMRSLQFGGKPIEISPNRIYNCAYLPIDDWRAFGEVMFLLLGGTGVGYSVQKHHIDKLPEIRKPNPVKLKRFLVSDSIEGWADAVKHLIKSYFRGGPSLHFDFSDIRPKGTELVTSGGKAPGPEPLKICLTNIEKILAKKADGDKLSSIEVHDIICHIADAVLAGGIRRAALISLFSASDQDMMHCKTKFKIESYEQIYEEGPVNQQGEPTKVLAVHEVQNGDRVDKYYDLKVVVDEPFYGKSEKIIYWVDEKDIQKYLKPHSVLPWYYFQPQRGRANNSVVLVRSRITKKKFMEIWKVIQASGSGEPGFYFTHDKDWGTNPCLTGDTEIYTEDGIWLLKDLVDAYETGSFCPRIFTVNEKTQEIELDEINFATLTKKSANIIELELEDGQKIKLTPDHKVFTKNRGWVEAAQLNQNDILLKIE